MRILFVYPGNTANPDGSGGQKRAYNLLRQLATCNEIFVLEPTTEEYGTHNVDGVTRISCFHPFPDLLLDFNPLFAYVVGKTVWREDIDAVHVCFPSGVPSAKAAVELIGRDVPVVFGAQSVAGDIIDSLIDETLPRYKRIVAPEYIPALERLAVSMADHVTTVSDEDAQMFQRLYETSPEKITTIPTGAQLSQPNSSREHVRTEYNIPKDDVVLLFHGIYDYQPNRAAIRAITDRIAPAVADGRDDVTFVVAGKGVPRFETENVRSIGFVPELSSLLHAVDVGVVPLTEGGGTKLKVLDYIGSGLPVVSTRTGVEGIDLENGKAALISDDVDTDFLEHVTMLVESPRKRKRLGANALKVAEAKYDWNTVGTKLDDLYERLAGNA